MIFAEWVNAPSEASVQIKGIEKALVRLKVQFFEESISIMNDNPTFFFRKSKAVGFSVKE